MAVEIAPDAFHVDKIVRRSSAGCLAQLGRAVRDAQELEELEFVARGRQRLEGLHVLGRAGLAKELGTEQMWFRDGERHRHTVDSQPDRPPRVTFEEHDDGGQPREAVDDLVRPLRRRNDAKLVGQLAEAAWCSCDLARERLGDLG